MAFFLKLKLNYLSKMHGYPQFSFWIPRVLTKIYFLRIVLNLGKYPCISKHHRSEIRVSRDAQNVCAITIVGTVLKWAFQDEALFCLLSVYHTVYNLFTDLSQFLLGPAFIALL